MARLKQGFHPGRDLVAGIPRERVGGTVAVKITDMLGEEVLVALPAP